MNRNSLPMGKGDNMKNIEAFTGRAQAYSIARPGYPKEAIEYICSLVPTDSVFADIGAGTGKFTELLAKHRYSIFAVEPNDDMRAELVKTLASFPNATIVNGSAEATTLSEKSVYVITNAQTLNRVDIDLFRAYPKKAWMSSPMRRH